MSEFVSVKVVLAPNIGRGDMSLEKDKYAGFVATCDNCDDFLETPDASDFREAVEEIKEQGWLVKMLDGEWKHICPTCKKEMP